MTSCARCSTRMPHGSTTWIEHQGTARHNAAVVRCRQPRPTSQVDFAEVEKAMDALLLKGPHDARST